MRLKTFVVSVAVSVALSAEPYTLGQGVAINDALHVGGYFSSEFESHQGTETATLDDVAFVAYGDINPMLSYLAEFEATGFYHKNLSNGEESGSQKFHIERLYGDLWLADAYNIRFGKQMTPVGYWNKMPINVLRDTTSNPLYSLLLFPKFLTGIDVNGYLPLSEGTKYHLFAQATRDMDEAYINIPNTHFYGVAIEQEFSNDWYGGGSMGEYIVSSNVSLLQSTYVSPREKVRFIQANIKYDDMRWQGIAEALVSQNEYSSNESGYTYSAYMQGMYRLNEQHALVGRYEHYNEKHGHYEDNIATVGYSYRPWYSVSLKGEYQWHSQHDENSALFSFSVLF